MGFYLLKEGRVWNPLKGWPRNALCFCGSEKKAKACHLPKVPETCQASEAPGLRALVQAGIQAVKDGQRIAVQVRERASSSPGDQ